MVSVTKLQSQKSIDLIKRPFKHIWRMRTDVAFLLLDFIFSAKMSRSLHRFQRNNSHFRSHQDHHSGTQLLIGKNPIWICLSYLIENRRNVKSSGVELLFYIRPSLSDGKGFEVHSRLVEGNLLLSKTLIFHQTLLKKQRKKFSPKGSCGGDLLARIWVILWPWRIEKVVWLWRAKERLPPTTSEKWT